MSYDINDPKPAVRLGMFFRRQIEPSLHGLVHLEIMDLWSKGATEEGKIRDDGSI